MKKISCWIILAGWFVGSYATDARVFTMGGHDDFFMDDYSIFRNPANINYYPNMLLGSPGVLLQNSDTGAYAALQRKNTDPQRPYFGPILSYSLNQSSESGTQYPLLSASVILNRYDDMLDYLNPYSKTFTDAFPSLTIPANDSRHSLAVLTPIGKIDFMLGYALQNGVMIGASGYFAFQKEDTLGQLLESSLYRGNIGVNWPIAKSMNLEVSVGITSITGLCGMVDTFISKTNAESVDTIANNDISVRGDIRLFSALTSLNGDFVPHFGINYVSLHDYSDLNVAFGLGVNVNIDKGFFWAALEGLYEAKDYSMGNADSLPTGVGGRISAGLERNVLFDWWVWRIGVNKQLMYVSNGSSNGHWEQNPEADGSNHDSFALGWGLNIENRLKVDVVLAEDMFYTWTNLISGSAAHLTNRITATYSF
jgi:hypothetical protein